MFDIKIENHAHYCKKCGRKWEHINLECKSWNYGYLTCIECAGSSKYPSKYKMTRGLCIE